MTELSRLRWYSQAVHYGRRMRHVEALRRSSVFGSLLKKVNDARTCCL